MRSVSNPRLICGSVYPCVVFCAVRVVSKEPTLLFLAQISCCVYFWSDMRLSPLYWDPKQAYCANPKW
jgi:hypothetical protein